VRTPFLTSTALVVATTLAATAGLAASGCTSTTSGDGSRDGDPALALAFEQRASDLEVEGQGTVVRILADDTEGGRHQRFILRLASGQTLLVAHNIDAAPRIDDLRVGDVVAFRGVYEWGEEGGTIHWTHSDPESAHAPGWIRHDGRTYE